MQLVERESQLDRMAALLGEVEGGRGGRCVLIAGEAGIGKTAFVRRFSEQYAARFEIFHGGCEALFAPRPLGPLADLCEQLPPGLAASIHDGRTHNGLFPALLGFLRERTRTALFVIDDVHWADEATLDLVKYLGRRIASARALLVLTYRDTDLGLDHPLVRVFGEMPAASTHRLTIPPLSECAVTALARQSGRAAEGLYRATAGNPFFLGEALAVPPGQVPASVRDAVLARVAQLSPAARRVVELASLAPARIERVLIKTMLGSVAAALDECLDRGVLQAERGQVAFRHELARQSVEQSLPPGRVVAMHAELFRALRDGPGPAQLSRLVHHAERAGLTADVLRLAPRAAAEAVKVSAHREAAKLYALALDEDDGAPLEQRAGLLEAAAREYKLINALDRAIVAQEEALVLRRALGDVVGEGRSLGLLATLHYERGDGRATFVREARAAIDVLERMPASGALIDAYATLSHALVLESRYAEGVVWGERAVRMAESSGDPCALVTALYRLASARLGARDDTDARSLLERALALALEQRRDEIAGSMLISLQTFALIYHDHAAALAYAERGLAYCEARDLDRFVWGIHERQALSLFELGRWDEAEGMLERCLAVKRLTPMARDTALFLRRRLVARRGQPDDEKFWDIPRLLDGPLHIEYRPPYIAAACAEVAWLHGDHETVERAARAGLAIAFAGGEVRLIGPLLVWLKRVGVDLPERPPLLPPHEAELRGDCEAAAAAWHRHGCSYEQAMALMAGDELAVRRAIALFDALGALPAARIARRRLRAAGVRGVQRGPQPRTRTDPQGLTRREREIFDLLAQGLSNQAIARRLHRSTRTVEHHVAALLAKLGVASRADAVALATASGPRPKN